MTRDLETNQNPETPISDLNLRQPEESQRCPRDQILTARDARQKQQQAKIHPTDIEAPVDDEVPASPDLSKTRKTTLDLAAFAEVRPTKGVLPSSETWRVD